MLSPELPELRVPGTAELPRALLLLIPTARRG